MRMTTHIVVGAAAAGVVSAEVGCSFECALLSMILSALINIAIDAAGHTRRNGRVFRRKATHSFDIIVPAGALLGFSVALSLGLAPADSLRAAAAVGAGAASHLVLDMLTPGGVYLRGRRVRLPLFNWDNPEVNLVFTMAGLLALIAVAQEYSAALRGLG